MLTIFKNSSNTKSYAIWYNEGPNINETEIPNINITITNGINIWKSSLIIKDIKPNSRKLDNDKEYYTKFKTALTNNSIIYDLEFIEDNHLILKVLENLENSTNKLLLFKNKLLPDMQETQLQMIDLLTQVSLIMKENEINRLNIQEEVNINKIHINTLINELNNNNTIKDTVQNELIKKMRLLLNTKKREIKYQRTINQSLINSYNEDNQQLSNNNIDIINNNIDNSIGTINTDSIDNINTDMFIYTHTTNKPSTKTRKRKKTIDTDNIINTINKDIMISLIKSKKNKNEQLEIMKKNLASNQKVPQQDEEVMNQSQDILLHHEVEDIIHTNNDTISNHNDNSNNNDNNSSNDSNNEYNLTQSQKMHNKKVIFDSNNNNHNSCSSNKQKNIIYIKNKSILSKFLDEDDSD